MIDLLTKDLNSEQSEKFSLLAGMAQVQCWNILNQVRRSVEEEHLSRIFQNSIELCRVS